MKYKIKIITGFREDQVYSIDAEEAHKAYFLFLHPEQRGILNSGLALRGSDIQKIEPDYQRTMGWNATHELDNDDWNELHGKGVDVKMREIMNSAQAVAKMPNASISLPLSEAVKSLPEKPKEISEGVKQLLDKMKI